MRITTKVANNVFHEDILNICLISYHNNHNNVSYATADLFIFFLNPLISYNRRLFVYSNITFNVVDHQQNFILQVHTTRHNKLYLIIIGLSVVLENL